MKTEALFLLLILILGLFLCSFLGGNCGKEGFTSTSINLVTGSTFTDTNGNTITVIAGSNGTQSLQLVQVPKSSPIAQTTPIQPIVLSSTPPTGMTAAVNTYYAQPPINITAVVSTGSNGQMTIQVNLPRGQTLTLTETGSSGSSTSSSAIQLQTGSIFLDPSGNTITVIVNSDGSQSLQLVQISQPNYPTILGLTPPSGTTSAINTYYAQPPSLMKATVITNSNGQTAIQVNLAGGQTIIFSQQGSPYQMGASSMSYNGAYGGSAGSATSPYTTSSSSSSSLSNTGTAIQLQTGTIFVDPSGNTITVIVNSDGSQSLQLVQISQPNYPTILGLTPPSGTTAAVNTYYAQGPLKMTANVYTGSDGQTAIQVSLAGGQIIVFSQHGSAAVSSQSNNGSITSTQYYGSTGSPYQTGASSMSYNGAYGGSAGSATGPYGNTAYYAQGPYGNTAAGTASNPYYTQAPSNNSGDYNSSLPPGIPASQIPSGQEDLYILKSQVVPPVCPVCPACKNSSNNDPDSAPKCPPCPACARCPEPSFECKKVPNYSSINNSYLPQPIINSFSSFGM